MSEQPKKEFQEHEVILIKGTIIHSYNSSRKVYEIELIDVNGKSHLITLAKDQMTELIKAENQEKQK
jgi:hypothetical protein